MLLNISSDNIQIFTGKENIYLNRRNLEKDFPKTLSQLDIPQYIYIINGPGSFTNLRVGTLTLNTINFLKNFILNFYDLSKIDFYKYFINKNFLPKYGIIFIGQRKNARLYDFELNNFQIIKYEEIQNLKNDYFIDQISIDFNENLNNLKHKIININYNKDNLTIEFENKKYTINISNLSWKKTKILKPNYMIQPNICLA